MGEAVAPAGPRPRVAAQDSLCGHRTAVSGHPETERRPSRVARRLAPAPALVMDRLVGAIRAVVFLVPGALGVQEGGYVLLCALFGLPPGAALALSLARRGRAVLIAAPVLLSWEWREGRTLPG